MSYVVKSITPKYQKSDNKLLWFNITVENDKKTYTYSDFYSVDDMKKSFGVETPENAKLLEWKSADLIQNIIINR